MDKHKFPLLLPQNLWLRLKALASRNRRPITQEIIIALEGHIALDEKEAIKCEPLPRLDKGDI